MLTIVPRLSCAIHRRETAAVGRRSQRSGGGPASYDVELVVPNPGAFSEAGGYETLRTGVAVLADVAFEEPPRRRLGTAIAGAGVMALLFGGVIAAAPWDPAGGQAVPATTLATPQATTQAAPIALGADDLDRLGGLDDTVTHGLQLDPVPDGFLAQAARTDVGVGEEFPDAPTGWGVVWASAGATRTSGRWASITLSPFAVDVAGRAAERLSVGGRPAFLGSDADGVLRLTFDVIQGPGAGGQDGRSVTISSGGLRPDELVALAGSITVDELPGDADDRLRFDDPALLDGMTEIAAEATDDDLVDAAVFQPVTTSTTWYQSAAGEIIAVQLLGDAVGTTPVDSLALTAVDGLWPGTSAGPGFDGHDVHIGRRAFDDRALTVVDWVSDGAAMAMTTTLSPEATVALVGSVRRSNYSEWTALVDSIALNRMSVGERVGQSTMIGAGTFSDGESWSATVWPDDVIYRVEVGADAGDSRFGSTDAADLVIDSRRSGTIVVARDDARADAGVSVLRIVTAAGTTDVALSAAVDSISRDVFAAAAFEVAGPFRAEIVRSDGSIAATYASPNEPR